MSIHLINSYPNLDAAQKKKFVEQILSAPFTLNITELRYLFDTGFPFIPWDRLWLARCFEFVDHHAESGSGKRRPKSLQVWITAQRYKRKRGRLDIGREQLLNRIGFVWDPFEEQWNRQCLDLKEYLKAQGRIRASRSLQSWMWITRKNWDQLPKDKQKQLEKLGFPRQGPFIDFVTRKHMDQLEVMYAKKGNLVGVNDNQQCFIRKVRKLKQQGLLDPILKRRLDKIGIAWLQRGVDRGYPSVWEMRFAEAKAYLTEVSPDVPAFRRWPNQTLALWAKLQSRAWNHRSPDQQERLLSLGLKPSPTFKDQWSSQYKRALAASRELGLYKRSVWVKAHRTVVHWVSRQMVIWNSLTPKQQKKLTAIGIGSKSDCIIDLKKWEMSYNKARDYFYATDELKSKYPNRTVTLLKTWVQNQVLGWSRLGPDQRQKIQPLAQQIPPLKRQNYQLAWKRVFGKDSRLQQDQRL